MRYRQRQQRLDGDQGRREPWMARQGGEYSARKVAGRNMKLLPTMYGDKTVIIHEPPTHLISRFKK